MSSNAILFEKENFLSSDKFKPMRASWLLFFPVIAAIYGIKSSGGTRASHSVLNFYVNGKCTSSAIVRSLECPWKFYLSPGGMP
jgi:hypothetical protein